MSASFNWEGPNAEQTERFSSFEKHWLEMAIRSATEMRDSIMFMLSRATSLEGIAAHLKIPFPVIGSLYALLGMPMGPTVTAIASGPTPAVVVASGPTPAVVVASATEPPHQMSKKKVNADIADRVTEKNAGHRVDLAKLNLRGAPSERLCWPFNFVGDNSTLSTTKDALGDMAVALISEIHVRSVVDRGFISFIFPLT